MTSEEPEISYLKIYWMTFCQSLLHQRDDGICMIIKVSIIGDFFFRQERPGHASVESIVDRQYKGGGGAAAMAGYQRLTSTFHL